MTPPDLPNAAVVASIAREAQALADQPGTDPATASAGLLLAGLKLSTAQRGVGPTLALIVHVFGDLVDTGRAQLASDRIAPFDPDQPDAGRGALPARCGDRDPPVHRLPRRRVLPGQQGSEGGLGAQSVQPRPPIGGCGSIRPERRKTAIPAHRSAHDGDAIRPGYAPRPVATGGVEAEEQRHHHGWRRP